MDICNFLFLGYYHNKHFKFNEKNCQSPIHDATRRQLFKNNL